MKACKRNLRNSSQDSKDNEARIKPLRGVGEAQELGKDTLQEALRVILSDQLEEMKDETHVRKKDLDKLNEEMKMEFSVVKKMMKEIREQLEELKHGEPLR